MVHRAHWLVIGGPLSRYTFELFRAVSDLGDIGVRLLHDPLDNSGQFKHQSFEDERFDAKRWRGATLRELFRFMSAPAPSAVLLYGVEPRRALAMALLLFGRRIPICYFADTNIEAVVKERARLLPRLAAYRVLARRIDTAFSLGLTNETAYRLLGIGSVEQLPLYSVNFNEMDEAAQEPFEGIVQAAHTKANLVVVARFVEQKNIVAMLHAVGLDGDLASRVRFWMVGDGPLRGDIEATVRSCPTLDVRFVGAVEHRRVGSIIGAADALVLPSKVEPWGIVVTEALGLGVPVVATPAVGAAVSLAGTTQAIVLAQTASGEDISAAIRTFLARQNELSSAAKAAQTAIRSSYDVREVARRLLSTVERLQREGGSRSALG